MAADDYFHKLGIRVTRWCNWFTTDFLENNMLVAYGLVDWRTSCLKAEIRFRRRPGPDEKCQFRVSRADSAAVPVAVYTITEEDDEDPRNISKKVFWTPAPEFNNGHANPIGNAVYRLFHENKNPNRFFLTNVAVFIAFRIPERNLTVRVEIFRQHARDMVRFNWNLLIGHEWPEEWKTTPREEPLPQQQPQQQPPAPGQEPLENWRQVLRRKINWKTGPQK